MYLDPSEGRAGSVLDTIFGAATSGALRVDPQTGETTLRFLNQVQDLVAELARRSRDVTVTTPLGGGFGEEVGAFNQTLAAGGSSSAHEQLSTFGQQLEQLKDAVVRSMASYQSTDGGSARTITGAGAGR